MIEVWKEINWINTRHRSYYVSDLGRVKSVSKRTGEEKQMSIKDHGIPYLMINLSGVDGKQHHLLHRLLAIAFIPNPENKATVNHKDGNKRNNALSNLEWSTHSEQNVHASRLGLKKFNGEHHSQCKLTEPQVIEIRYRTLYADIPEGKEYGVTNATITDVIRRRSWSHI